MGDFGIAFDNTFASQFPELCQGWSANHIAHPVTLLVNEPLAQELGIDPEFLATRSGAEFLSGTTLPDGALPVAQAYAGHQFGGYSPRLGDGRALLVGEIIDRRGHRVDLHLKGSGRTPFARGGDGKAAIGPMVREFIIGEAMHGLGIPTTRALGVVATGESIARETLLPGAVLARIASSHIRVGTFQFAASLHEEDLVARLVHYCASRHQLAHEDTSKNAALSFLASVLERQAHLIAQWMLVGFVHGVMNTDNMTISGETIDFGPCAFMDRYDPTTVFSSIDTGGRYAYGNQPTIGQWNLARLAETLLPLIDADQNRAVDTAMSVLETYPEIFRTAWARGMRSKLGLPRTSIDPESDLVLFDTLLNIAQIAQVDYTSLFRLLSASLRQHGCAEPDPALRSQFANASEFDSWFDQWIRTLKMNGVDLGTVSDEMDSVNPVYIARNHAVESALAAAVEGDVGPARRLVDRLRQPFHPRPGDEDLLGPAPSDFGPYRTFCGT